MQGWNPKTPTLKARARRVAHCENRGLSWDRVGVGQRYGPQEARQRGVSGRSKPREVLRTGGMATGFSHQGRRFRAGEACSVRARSQQRGKRMGQG